MASITDPTSNPIDTTTNPNITNQELADTLQLTVKGIEWQIKKLKEDSKLERIGGAKGGHWEILK